MIHPTAIVEDGAQLGADCEIMAYAVVTRHCVLGDRVVVHPFTVVGGDPQYVKFDRSIRSGVRIGSGTVLRENVTINRAIGEGAFTTIGANCYFMAGSHAAHDCEVGDNVVMANASLLAGHVSVGANTFFGGGAAVHQFCRIGESVMVGGHASISRDVSHYLMVAERDEVVGLNVIGLKRRGVARAAIAELKAAFQSVFFTPGNIREVAASQLAAGAVETPEARRFLEFFAGGKRSFARARRAAGREAGEAEAGE